MAMAASAMAPSNRCCVSSTISSRNRILCASAQGRAGFARRFGGAGVAMAFSGSSEERMAGTNSSASEVAVVSERGENSSPPAKKKQSPLERGGTLSGEAAEGKDPSAAALGQKKSAVVVSGKFEDPRWKNGNWDMTMFLKDGKMDWDAVIDAEVSRRKWLEENPEASSNDDPVLFDTAQVPWWAWVRRFHLPEAELLNGRAAMVGFFAAYLIDSLTGIGIVDQTNSFVGKLLLFITVVGILVVRKNDDIETIKTLFKESTFYDKQWQATWKDNGDEQKK